MSFVTGKVSDKGKTHCHFENKDKIRILTEKPGKDGYLGYVGVTIPVDKTDKWEKVREDFVDKADIKQENLNENPYISDEWLKGKKKWEKIFAGRGTKFVFEGVEISTLKDGIYPVLFKLESEEVRNEYIRKAEIKDLRKRVRDDRKRLEELIVQK